VVGGGWSGIAAALTLADAGCSVTLFEAAPQLGGRARRVELDLGGQHYPLDNGQHLLIGAYRQTLTLMQRLGLDLAQAFIREPFTLHYPDGFRLQASRAPAPLHLLGALLFARGLSAGERLAMARGVDRWKRAGWSAPRTLAASALMDGQPPRVVERIFQPLCVAALNVRLQDAAADIFLAVLRDSLGAERAAADLLLPRTDLSALLPDAAQAAFGPARVDVRLRCALAGLSRSGPGWTAFTRAGPCAIDAVVLALPPWRAAPLLATAAVPALDAAIGQLGRIAAAPIVTVYLRYAAGTRLPAVAMALAEDPDAQSFGQWVFDRGALDARCDGVFSVVVSAKGPHEALDHPALAVTVARQLTCALKLPPPLAMRVIEEKRATIAPSPGLARPPAALSTPGLFLASDSADSPYPSTIEGSVRSGVAAARALLACGG
jgi:squalene-associated FAD-dependent desaturase